MEIKVGKKEQQVVLRDLHRHPYKPIIMHIDFMRVSADELIRMSVPLHFVGEEESPAGKATGVIIQHQVTDVEISALPKDLPEYLTVDLSEMEAGDVVMLSAITLPEGVTIPVLETSEENDTAVANTVHIKEDQGTGAAAAAEAEAAMDELGGVAEGEEAPAAAADDAAADEGGDSEESSEDAS